ncbi:hypothetical protein AXA44_45490 [Rhodococcus sp. SC4]|nr:hypothetical protein AXA44_45490 [Rhodococcus sp. SC4]
MSTILRTRTTLVWVVLVAATLLSWTLGSSHGLGNLADHRGPSSVIMVIALVKVRFVGLYFMELRTAPIPLRVLFESFCIAVFLMLLGLYLYA